MEQILPVPGAPGENLPFSFNFCRGFLLFSASSLRELNWFLWSSKFFNNCLVRVYWHMDECQIALTNAGRRNGAMDGSVLNRVLSSISSLVHSFGYEQVTLLGHYNFEKYRLMSDELWELGYFYHVCVH